LNARLLLTFACAVAALALLAPAAVAVPAPSCWNPELWARPGIERTHELHCEFVESVVIATQPEHGAVDEVTWDGWTARLRYRPELDAPSTDSVELALTGPGGSATAKLTIHVVPLSENTAPSCTPIADAQRSDGTAPVEFQLSALCSDAEHDGMTLHGAGPGVHVDDPTVIRGGHIHAFWRYRTAAVDGAELATYWAVDDLGARSADAGISLLVGPDVNRPPTCRPNTAWESEASWLVRMRSGTPRNFGIVCEDADGDAFTPSLGVLPEHGSIGTFEPVPGQGPFPGHPHERWVDTTYVPAAGFLGPDRFTVVAASPGGDRTETLVRMVPVPAEENGAGSCGFSSTTTRVDTPVLVTMGCDDAEGDPLQAEVTTPPDHGTLDPPAVMPSRLGERKFVVRYVPSPGFTGVDAVGISVGGGPEMTVAITVSDTGWPVPPTPPPVGPPPREPGNGDPMPGTTDPAPRSSGDPAPGQAEPLAPMEQAREALGTRAVTLVRTAGVAQIYARTRGVSRRAGRPALAVTCALACRVDVRQKGRRAGLQRISVEPGRAGVITVPRRARGNRLAFALRIRAEGAPVKRAEVRVRVRAA
jgi:hypothetical protein